VGVLPTEMVTIPAPLAPLTPGKSRRIARNSASSASSSSACSGETPDWASAAAAGSATDIGSSSAAGTILGLLDAVIACSSNIQNGTSSLRSLLRGGRIAFGGSTSCGSAGGANNGEPGGAAPWPNGCQPTMVSNGASTSP